MNVHFICLGNSFRSIMAEAYAKSLELDGFEFSSSGIVAKRTNTPNVKSHPIVVDALTAEGLRDFVKTDWGERTTQEHLDKADLNVFVNNNVIEEALRHGLQPKNVHILSIDDLNEGENLAKTNLSVPELISETLPLVCEQVDGLLKSEFGEIKN